MKRALVVGGNSGIGLAILLQLLQNGCEHVYSVGLSRPHVEDIPPQWQEAFEQRVTAYHVNLNTGDYSIFDEITDIDTLVITAGFGRVALFESLTETEIKNLINCNATAVMQVISKYYSKLKSHEDFTCAVMVSIAGHVASPYFAVYGAAKAAAAAFIENINVELAAAGCANRVMDVSPGSLKGTGFSGGQTDLEALAPLAEEILCRAARKETLFIPQYDEIYRGVLERYQADPMAYGLQSYQYKAESGRVSTKPQVVIGYLSGTFDLFHIGHLRLLKRAKRQCDYLIVGVHESGSWKGKTTFIPFEERKAIIAGTRYVDKVVTSPVEDLDAWHLYHYDKLFVGSDYKGSERFQKYEEYFADKGVEIVYFPYTQGTSSTQLRDKITQSAQKK